MGGFPALTPLLQRSVRHKIGLQGLIALHSRKADSFLPVAELTLCPSPVFPLETMIQIDVAELAGIVSEGILFGTPPVAAYASDTETHLFFIGIFLTLVSTALWILLERRGRGQRNFPFIVAALVMLGLSFAQIIVDTVNIFRAFIPLERPERLFFLLDVTEPIFAAKHSIYFTMMLVGDAIVVSTIRACWRVFLRPPQIYRAFIVWDKNYWIVVIPVLCWLGSGGSL